jgi:F-type H+-transporting ATPase subunit b
LKDAKRAASELIEQANKRKAQIIDEAKIEAQAERKNILAQGQAEIEAERNRARDDLRKQVATLAVIGAEKIIERTIDKDVHADLLNKVTAEL